jgi:hypothetical protein
MLIFHPVNSHRRRFLFVEPYAHKVCIDDAKKVDDSAKAHLNLRRHGGMPYR